MNQQVKSGNMSVWKAIIQHTLDLEYNTIQVEEDKAKIINNGLGKGGFYYLVLEAGYDVEIVKVTQVLPNGLLEVERGQANTLPGIWPAGTPLEGKISAKILEDFHLDPQHILSSNREVVMTPNGDLITKPLV